VATYDLELTGVPALVTGGGAGIGRATAILLAGLGARVAILDRDGNAAAAAAREINTSSGTAIALSADVCYEKDVIAAVAAAEARLGVIRILVNNAGIGERRPMLDLPLDGWKDVIDVNLTSVFHLTQIVVRRMVAAQVAGSIVNVASVAGLSGVLNRSSYAASKHGVVGLTRTLALELAAHHIRVNAVAPGIVSTKLTAALLSDQNAAARSAAAHPLGRVAEPREVADAIVFLASQRASFITGSVLKVDGGFLAGKSA